MLHIPQQEYSLFVYMAIDSVVRLLFEHGFTKKSARYFQNALKQFQNHAQKVT